MIEKNALEYLIGLGRTVVSEIDGQKYAISPFKIERLKSPAPESLTLHTLSGIVDYIKSMIDGLGEPIKTTENTDCEEEAFNTPALLQVVSPTIVSLFSPLLNDGQRFKYITV